MGPRGGHWFPRRHRAVASGRGSGRGWGGRRPRAPPRTPPAPAGRASPQRRLQTANPFFSSLAKETDPSDTSAALEQLSLQLLRFQNSSNPCTPIFEASLSISLHTPHSLGPSDQPPDPGSRVGRGGRCWVFIPAAFTGSWVLDECVSPMAWRGFSSALQFGSHCLPWGSSDLKECSEFTYDGAFLSAVSSAFPDPTSQNSIL